MKNYDWHSFVYPLCLGFLTGYIGTAIGLDGGRWYAFMGCVILAYLTGRITGRIDQAKEGTNGER